MTKSLFWTGFDRGIGFYSGLPVLSIKWNDGHIIDGTWIKAPVVDTSPIWIGTRGIKTLYSTNWTKGMLCLTSVKRVTCQVLSTLKAINKPITRFSLTKMWHSLVPRPHPSAREKGLVTFLLCAHWYAGYVYRYMSIWSPKWRTTKLHTYFVMPQVVTNAN